jgi:hypothetical protein
MDLERTEITGLFSIANANNCQEIFKNFRIFCQEGVKSALDSCNVFGKIKKRMGIDKKFKGRVRKVANKT